MHKIKWYDIKHDAFWKWSNDQKFYRFKREKVTKLSLKWKHLTNEMTWTKILKDHQNNSIEQN